jgi:hypothetical protein
LIKSYVLENKKEEEDSIDNIKYNFDFGEIIKEYEFYFFNYFSKLKDLNLGVNFKKKMLLPAFDGNSIFIY